MKEEEKGEEERRRGGTWRRNVKVKNKEHIGILPLPHHLWLTLS
jgi:hypothetical protein